MRRVITTKVHKAISGKHQRESGVAVLHFNSPHLAAGLILFDFFLTQALRRIPHRKIRQDLPSGSLYRRDTQRQPNCCLSAVQI